MFHLRFIKTKLQPYYCTSITQQQSMHTLWYFACISANFSSSATHFVKRDTGIMLHFCGDKQSQN